MANGPNYKDNPCCGYEHRWLPGAGVWVGMGPTRCRPGSLEQIEDFRAGKIDRHELELSYDAYQKLKKERTARVRPQRGAPVR